MSASDYDTCKAIADMQDNILGAGLIENLQVAAMYAKPNVPLPEEEKFKLMFAQSEILVNVAKTNEDFFGRVRYLVSSFENSDVVFLPYRSKTDRDRTLVIQILRPYDHDKIAEKIAQHLK
jgi:hypothetical protein